MPPPSIPITLNFNHPCGYVDEVGGECDDDCCAEGGRIIEFKVFVGFAFRWTDGRVNKRTLVIEELL